MFNGKKKERRESKWLQNFHFGWAVPLTLKSSWAECSVAIVVTWTVSDLTGGLRPPPHHPSTELKLMTFRSSLPHRKMIRTPSTRFTWGQSLCENPLISLSLSLFSLAVFLFFLLLVTSHFSLLAAINDIALSDRFVLRRCAED